MKTKRWHHHKYTQESDHLNIMLGYYDGFSVYLTNFSPTPALFDIRWGGSLIQQSFLILPRSKRKVDPTENNADMFMICPIADIEERDDAVVGDRMPEFEILDTRDGRGRTFKIFFLHNAIHDKPRPENFVSSKTMEVWFESIF